MANFDIPESPEYIEDVRKFETSDPAHATLLNEVIGILINNEAFLKNWTERHSNVDNTSDIDKPVSEPQQMKLDELYEQLTGYTDKEIADLIGGAPETLDTLKEVADAMAENSTVVDALNAAIGIKANKAELDSHVNNSNLHFTKNSIVDLIYPVGSVYISVSSASPATLFGGIWQQLPERFLIGAGSTYGAGTSGGENAHTLTTKEMPLHTHTFSGLSSNTSGENQSHYHSIPAMSGVTELGGVHDHNSGSFMINGGAVSYTPNWSATGSGDIKTSVDAGHIHRYNISAHNTNNQSTGHSHAIIPAGNNGSTGGSTPHNNMPPYLAVYMWKRTA